MLVGVAFSAGHHFGVNDVLEVTLVRKDIVNEVPIFGPRLHPGCFKSVLLLEDGVGDDKLVLSEKLQQQVPVVFAVTNDVSAKYSFLGIYILAHSSIENINDYHLVVCRDALETVAERRVEVVFFCRFSSKRWSVHTEKRGIPLIFQRKAHRHHAVGIISWQIFQPGDNGSADHETDVWKAPLCCRFPWPEEGESDAMLLEDTITWELFE